MELTSEPESAVPVGATSGIPHTVTGGDDDDD
jgi:hypothetical protein